MIRYAAYKTIPVIRVCQSIVALAVVFVLSLIFISESFEVENIEQQFSRRKG